MNEYYKIEIGRRLEDGCVCLSSEEKYGSRYYGDYITVIIKPTNMSTIRNKINEVYEMFSEPEYKCAKAIHVYEESEYVDLED